MTRPSTIVGGSAHGNIGGNGGSAGNGGDAGGKGSATASIGGDAGDGGDAGGSGPYGGANLLSSGGGVSNTGELDLTNVTFGANTAGPLIDPAWGGAPGTPGTGIQGGKQGTQGRRASSAGVTGNALYTTTPVRMVNTVMAAATPGSVGPLCSGPVTDAGRNLVADGSCINGGVATDPGLDPNGLGDHGGPTKTIALLPTSAAVNAGFGPVCDLPPVNHVDQRGVTRPREYCDSGAYQHEPATDVGSPLPPTTTPTAPPTTTPTAPPTTTPTAPPTTTPTAPPTTRPPPITASAASTTVHASGPQLASTGMEAGALLITALALMALGTGVLGIGLLLHRRRRN